MGSLINGVIVKALKAIKDERGAVMHMLRSDDEHFTGFGEVYFSTINPGVIKAWKEHTQQTQRFTVIAGCVEFVLYDGRKQEASYGQLMEVKIDPDNYQLLIIPPGVIYGFQSINQSKAIVANCTDIPHNPEEGRSYALTDPVVPYSWGKG